MKAKSFSFMVMVGLQVLCVASYKVSMSPSHKRISEDPQSVTFKCSTNVALAECQFRWWDGEAYRTTGPQLELNRGWQADPNHLDPTALTAYSYFGRGLGAGDCGVSLQVRGFKQWLVACRVRTETGGWKYAWADLIADELDSLGHKLLMPIEAIVLPGDVAIFNVKSQESLTNCFYVHKNREVSFTPGSRSRNTGRYRSYGSGIQSGECGLEIRNVEEADNGPVMSYIGNGQRSDWRFMTLIVASPPDKPILSLNYTGNIVTTTCEVKGGRPTANVSWYLGSERIRWKDNDFHAKTKDEWRWPWMSEDIKRTLTFPLQPHDEGKDLKCIVSNIALNRPLVSQEQLTKEGPTTERIIPLTDAPVIALPGPTTLCPPLTSQSVLISCSWAGEEVNCSQPQQVATEARLVCKPGFEPHTSVAYSRITCRRSGRWSHPIFTCFPACGQRILNDGDTLISDGRDVKIGELPWHVGIYEVLPGTGTTLQICGGTLITPKVVVTAAHCLWHSPTERKKDASLYKVAAGKHLRAWDDPDPSVQKRNVSETVLHELFRGRNTGFASDIGIVRVESPFDINARVNLVCVDWGSTMERKQLAAGSVGVVAGWGYTEEGVQSDLLKYVDLPFIPAGTCLDSLQRHQQVLLTTDKFCAGFVNQSTSVCGGDSGGSLVFLDPGSEKYYLRGIVSISFTPFEDTSVCYSQHYTAFTKFSHYITWFHDNGV